MRSLCRVVLSLGAGQGGLLMSWRYDVVPGKEEAHRALVETRLRLLAERPQIVGAHLCRSDSAASAVQTAEKSAPAVPLDRVTSFSTRTVSTRYYGLLKVRSREGVEGIGFCYIGRTAGAFFAAIVEKLLAPLLIGKDSYAVEALWQAMYQESLLQGRAGIVMRAISVLDTALWDLNARTPQLHKNGRIILHQEPGLGFHFDEASVGKYAKWSTVRRS